MSWFNPITVDKDLENYPNIKRLYLKGEIELLKTICNNISIKFIKESKYFTKTDIFDEVEKIIKKFK